MADPTAVAHNATILTALTGLAGGIIAGYFGYKAKVGERQVDGGAAVEVKRLDNAALSENHLWEALKEKEKALADATAELGKKITELAKAEARIIILEAQISENPGDLKPQRVLIVDDFSDFIRMLKIMLRDEPYEIQTAGTGRIALSLYEQAAATGHPFDLLLLDIDMPEMSGIEVARAVRANGDSETRIVWLTANPQLAKPRDENGAILHDYTAEFEVFDTITKPCDHGTLQSRIKKALAT